jgi:hypothetical protein
MPYLGSGITLIRPEAEAEEGHMPQEAALDDFVGLFV